MGLEVLGIDAVTCEGVIVFRWMGSVGQGQVKGINVLYTSQDEASGGGAGQGVGGWVITKVFSEFNSGVWAKSIGGSCEPPSFGGQGSGSSEGPPS